MVTGSKKKKIIKLGSPEGPVLVLKQKGRKSNQGSYVDKVQGSTIQMKIKNVCIVISGHHFSFSSESSFSEKVDLILGGLSSNEALSPPAAWRWGLIPGAVWHLSALPEHHRHLNNCTYFTGPSCLLFKSVCNLEAVIIFFMQ